jgi:hypothetical protein
MKKLDFIAVDRLAREALISAACSLRQPSPVIPVANACTDRRTLDAQYNCLSELTSSRPLVAPLPVLASL